MKLSGGLPHCDSLKMKVLWMFQNHCFFKKGPKNQQILKNSKHFFAFLVAILCGFSMVYCLFSFFQWLLIHRRKRLNFTAVKSHPATTVEHTSSKNVSCHAKQDKVFYHLLSRANFVWLIP